ncbi:unnamed protein product [Arabis nemorensis]|uniref:Uncharacterized protein n=1 Tax=Arabis nemorensis TaxID=586526 RepID=A0A565B514_9BRAS|nr:unnamed protein product [Arabis nemorensis]
MVYAFVDCKIFLLSGRGTKYSENTSHVLAKKRSSHAGSVSGVERAGKGTKEYEDILGKKKTSHVLAKKTSELYENV